MLIFCKFAKQNDINFAVVKKMIIFVLMEALKIDRSKLITVTNYGRKIKVSRQTVYNMINNGDLRTVLIDGVIFVIMD